MGAGRPKGKILVLSDSHGLTGGMVETARVVAPDLVLHLGDNVGDAACLERLGLEVFAVKGNCDYAPGAEERVVEAFGLKIFMTHGHRRDVKRSYDGLVYAALERGADFAVFGHTHIPELFSEDALTVMNPGSISLPRAGKPAYGVIDVENGLISAVVIFKEGNGVCRQWRRIER